MRRRTLFTVAVAALTLCAVVVAWALIRPKPQSPPHVSALPQVVGDLQFVEDGSLSDPINSHDKQLPLPTRFETGHRYVFHNMYGTLHDLDFYKQLVERFRSNGFDTRGSFSSDDPGQPWPTHHRDVIFRIVFRDASYSGYLERRLDLSFPKSDGFSDYVLAIESTQ